MQSNNVRDIHHVHVVYMLLLVVGWLFLRIYLALNSDLSAIS